MEEVVSGELHKWEKEGTELKGVIISYEQQPDRGKGVGNIYELETPQGTVPFFAPTILHKKLGGIKAVNMCVGITQEATTETKSGNTLKNFSVKKGEINEENLKFVEFPNFKAVGAMAEETEGEDEPY